MPIPFRGEEIIGFGLYARVHAFVFDQPVGFQEQLTSPLSQGALLLHSRIAGIHIVGKLGEEQSFFVGSVLCQLTALFQQTVHR